MFSKSPIALAVLFSSMATQAATFSVVGTDISSDDAGFSQQSANSYYLPSTDGDFTTITFSDGKGFTFTSSDELDFGNSSNSNIVGIQSGGTTVNAIIGYGYLADVLIIDSVSGATLISGEYQTDLWAGRTGFEPAFVLDYSGGELMVRAVGDVSSVNADGSFSFSSGPTYFALGSFTLAASYTLSDAAPSLLATSYGLDSSFSTTSLLVNGAHSRPLSRYVPSGENSFWVAGDLGTDNHGDRDGKVGLAEVGAGHNYGPVQINFAIGRTYADQTLIHSGDIDADGKYIMLESIIPINENGQVFATLGAYKLWGDVDIKRGYLVGANLESSSASPDSDSWGVRARLDWANAFTFEDSKFSPYADLYYGKTNLDAYTEIGGAFPAQFNERKEEITELRLGVNSVTTIASSEFDFVANLEAVHRFNDKASNVTGQVAGAGFTFDIAGQDYEQNWVKLGLGLEGKIGDGNLSVMLNGTRKSEQSDAWLAASYTLPF